MAMVFRSEFFLRFAGGFALGAAMVGGSQLVGWLGTVAHVA